jgi:hypothetical protein
MSLPLVKAKSEVISQMVFLRAQTLTVSFKKPFDLLVETNVAVPNIADVSERDSRWWWTLQSARTFFDENPS